MKLSEFDFDLPRQLIARYPTAVRSASRLLHLDAISGAMNHYLFAQLPELLQPHDLLVVNNSRVIPARIVGRKQTGGKVEILLERILGEQQAIAQLGTSKSLAPGVGIHIAQDLPAIKVVRRQGEFYVLDFPPPGPARIAARLGKMPLPPYLNREAEPIDQERYQTIYAQEDGAVAAPTAGLHFDQTVFAALDAKGVARTAVTLHVGAGTFQPVRTEEIEQHRMHAEYIEVSTEVCTAVARCRKQGGRIVAVGTTSVRALETATMNGNISPYQGDTDIFIYPGYEFRSVDVLLTNFHLPGSTLLMLVSAFAGADKTRHAYLEAVQKAYRFFSYGDAMLITR